MVIPCGERLGIYTVAMHEYWRRVSAAMADYVGQAKGSKFQFLITTQILLSLQLCLLLLRPQFLMQIDKTWVLRNGMNHKVVGFCIVPCSL